MDTSDTDPDGDSVGPGETEDMDGRYGEESGGDDDNESGGKEEGKEELSVEEVEVDPNVQVNWLLELELFYLHHNFVPNIYAISNLPGYTQLDKSLQSAVHLALPEPPPQYVFLAECLEGGELWNVCEGHDKQEIVREWGAKIVVDPCRHTLHGRHGP
ncbi:hypothetical protein L218DRAFT_1047466 [Marasmius fiardii PR-910]|nr:hypothetical protein L218DRAFT_1047466 [Marasmius fiardii PR-910]